MAKYIDGFVVPVPILIMSKQYVKAALVCVLQEYPEVGDSKYLECLLL